MHLKNLLSSISRKAILIISGILVSAGILFFIWENNKYKIVNDKIASAIASKTDSLYSIKYDSIYFDEVTGNATLQNIRIVPDTEWIKSLRAEDMPFILLDIKIKTITVRGVKTAKALNGRKMVGDSVIIDHPEIIMYSLRPLEKRTKIESEVSKVYKEILGKLDIIKVGFVFVNNVNVKSIDFFSKEKNFDFINGKFLLEDVLIDSAHNLDTNRILFCKQAAFTIDSFISYNNSRRELSVRDINFLGKQQLLLFNEISLNRFPDDSSNGIRLLDAKVLKLSGVNTNEIIKNKNIVVDTISCKKITLYELPVENLKSRKPDKPKHNDSTGFRHSYGVYMKHLNFPQVTFVPFSKSSYTLGNIAIKVNDVKADEIIKLQLHPIDYSKEAEISCTKISMKSDDKFYNYTFQNVALNSLQKQLKIGAINIKSFFSEKEFANKAHFQKDRYDVSLNGIALKGINMKNLLDKKIFASDLVINNTSVKIYRDLQKPLDGKSKVGNYPPQMLKKLELPINISHVVLQNAFIQYKEREALSDSTGEINFANSKITISNITNIPAAIVKNNATIISFDSKALNEIPVKGEFKFFLGGNGGNFAVKGHVSAFDALILNKISVSMALIRLHTGTINSMDFNFTGDDYGAKGNFIMKYDHLKVDVLKRDKDSKEIKKKGLVSLIANIIVKNENPRNGELRKETPEFKRDIHKSFFNLVWKTIFTGMKKTLGMP